MKRRTKQRPLTNMIHLRSEGFCPFRWEGGKLLAWINNEEWCEVEKTDETDENGDAIFQKSTVIPMWVFSGMKS